MPLLSSDHRAGLLGGTLLILVLAWPPATARAQLSESERDRLAQQLLAAQETLDADRLPDVASVQQEVLSDMQAVREYFTGATDPQNYQAWMDYLRLEPLEQAIQEDRPAPVQGRAALQLQQRLIGVAPGLELPAVRGLRESVQRLVGALRFRQGEQSLEAIRDQLEALAERVRQLDRVPSAEDAAAISTAIGILQQSGQAREAIAALRQAFSRANAKVWVREDVIQRVVSRAVNQTEPVRDCILGTRLVGCASLRGAVTADLLPSRGTARLLVTLAADFSSNNTGYNHPVRLKTTGTGQVTAWRTLYLDESGVQPEEEVFVRVWLDSQIDSIQHHLRLVRKIAWKQARRQKPLADRIATEKLRRRVGEQFASQTAEAAALSPPEVLDEARPWLQRLDLPQPSPFWGSTHQALFIQAVIRQSDQLATVVSPPPVTAGSYAAAVQVHESAVRNALSPMLAGRTIDQTLLRDLLDSIDRGPAADNAAPEDDAAFELEFARFRPVIFEAREETVRVGVRGTRFEQDGRSLNRPLEITAVYRPQQSEGVTTLVREGEVDVDFPGGGRLSLAQTALRSSIQEAFDDLFPPVLLDRPITVPEDAEIEALRDRTFRVRWIEATQGWLSVAIGNGT